MKTKTKDNLAAGLFTMSILLFATAGIIFVFELLTGEHNMKDWMYGIMIGVGITCFILTITVMPYVSHDCLNKPETLHQECRDNKCQCECHEDRQS